MGYTHYWRREKSISEEDYRHIVDDFRKLLPIFVRNDTPLANGLGEGYPTIDYDDVCFNGAVHCGHPANHEIVIPWPTRKAHGTGDNAAAIAGNWFAGVEIQTRCCDGDCSYESFSFPKVLERQEPTGKISYYDMAGRPFYNDPKHVGRYFNFCKTAFRPYDWAVTAFLVITKHYLGDKIIISSDGELDHWRDAMILCELELGYGLEFQLNE